MTDTVEYLLILAISVALTIAVGRLLLVAGNPFLQEVFRDQKVTRSVNRLLNVLFHLVTLGVLAIISGIDFDLGDSVQTIVVKIGVVLLVLGIAYGISMLVLIRIRERRRAAQISEEVDERLAARGMPNRPHPQQMPPPDQPVAPPPGQPTPTQR
jgi:protein-S-isoprenylcysteine O-methyltransferase Ste14